MIARFASITLINISLLHNNFRFAHDLNYLTTLIAQQGTILVEGVPFYGNNHPASSLQQQQRTPPESRPSQSQRQQQQQQILQQHQYRNMSPYQQQQFMMQQRMRAAMGSSSPTSTMGGSAGHSSNHPRNPPTLQGPMHRNMPAHLGGPQSKHFTPPAQSSAISSSNHRMNSPQWNQQPGQSTGCEESVIRHCLGIFVRITVYEILRSI